MGHLINSKSMRLGLLSNWHDEWFSELQYYPEYLHSIYRIRFFLVYYFNYHRLEQRAFFFSHFDILKIYKKLKINIYYYDGQGESIYSDMWHAFKINMLEKKEKRKSWKKTKKFNKRAYKSNCYIPIIIYI